MKKHLITAMWFVVCSLLLTLFATCGPRIVHMDTPNWAKPQWKPSKDGSYFYTTTDDGAIAVISSTRSNNLEEAKRLCGVCTLDNYFYFLLTPVKR